MKNSNSNLILSLGCLISFYIFSIAQAQTSFNISNQTTGDTLFTIDENGQVGIGTTTPGATIEAKSDAVETGTTLSLGNADDSHYLFMFSGRGGGSPLGPGFYWQNPDPLRFVTWDGQYSELMRLTAAGNLGIGTNNPESKLDLQMFGNGLWQRAIRVLNPDMVDTDALFLVLGRSDDFKNMGHMNFKYIGDASDDNRLSFGLYGVNDVLNVLGSGNVGIGTTSPRTMLEVADTIRSSFGGFQFPDGTVQETAATSSGASSINDLTDGKTGGGSVFLGSGAGSGDLGSNNYNSALGENTLFTNTEGEDNTAFGVNALYSNLTGSRNVGIGPYSNYYNQLGNYNTIIGYQAGRGTALHNKSGNIFLGYQAGYNETGNNKLYIENSNSGSPLIGGDFALDEIYLNGNIGIGTASPGAGIHLVGDGYPNSFMFIQSQADGDAGMRFYEDVTAKWHIFNNANLDGLQIYNTAAAHNVFFAEQSTGHVGIGTTSPGYPLSVNGTIHSISGGFRFPDGTTQTTAAIGGGGGNTLDQAYDEGGAGAGRSITADAGAFEVGGIDGVLFTGTNGSGTIPLEGQGTRMMWYPAESAVRAGYLSATRAGAWDADSIGEYSTAFGYNTRASGSGASAAIGYGAMATNQTSIALGFYTKAGSNFATAMGNYTRALGQNSTAMGWETIANNTCATAMGYQTDALGYASVAMGDHSTASSNWSTAIGYYTAAGGFFSTAMGRETVAAGNISTAMGYNTNAQSYCSTVLGRYNIGGGNSSSWISTDPIFEIGVGTSSTSRANAVTVLKNGNVEIGTRIITPILEITGGSDLSEQFNIKEIEGHIKPGMVVSINPKEPGELMISDKAYDRKVAGIISGAGGIETGLLMGQNSSVADGDHPVALSGRVYCLTEASNGAIEPGDLLTTSNKPGYAMKVTDHSKAQGAIIGKAMSALDDGQGLILVLVSLQ